MIKIFFVIFSFLFLIYMVLPGPTRVEEFGALPNSFKSVEPGDTIQIPNIAAYYSDLWRKDVIPFYKDKFSRNFTYFGISLPFININHPPERGHDLIKPHVESWYLEEFVHPLRESLFVNGWEPYDENGVRRTKYAYKITVNGTPYISKTNLRYYPSPLWARLLTWLGVVVSLLLLYQLSKRIFKETYA
jgi:hypothetical protein